MVTVTAVTTVRLGSEAQTIYSAPESVARRIHLRVLSSG
jgi:hypothetical protein